MGLIGRMLGSEKALAGVVGVAASAIDKLKYTAEEKAADSAALLQRQAENVLAAQGQVVEWMKATTGQNLTRRTIALIIVGIWASSYVVRLLMLVAAVWWHSNAAQLKEAARLIDEGISDIEPHMITVIGFYFLMGGVADGIAAYKKRKDEKDG